MGTSVGAVVGVDELTGTAINISTENYRWIEMFIVVAGIYVVLTFIASLSLALARPLGLPGQGQGVLMHGPHHPSAPALLLPRPSDPAGSRPWARPWR